MRTTAPSLTTTSPMRPYTTQISDIYGQTIVLSQHAVAGDINQIEVASRDEDGNVLSAKVSGTFYEDQKENFSQTLARLSGMKQKSEQENEALLLVSGYPMFQIRGFIQNLGGPKVNASDLLYGWSFDFVKDTLARQPVAFSGPEGVLQEEGVPYVSFTIPNASLTNLREIAYLFYGERYTDGRKISKIVELNNLTFPQMRALTIGSVVKVPI